MRSDDQGQSQEPVVINAPTVDVYAPEWAEEWRHTVGILYSIQLDSGMIVTSPDKFPR